MSADDLSTILFGSIMVLMTKDLTKGHLLPLLIKFTIPLVLGNLLQLTYNAADSMIVGRFVGANALAAVGTSNPLMTLVLLFVNGICLGAGILIGTMYGAKKFDRLQRQVSTAMISGLVFSAAISVLTIFLAPYLLRLLQVEPEILADSTRYLRIIALGLIFSFIYNFFASTLRAMGDSRSPLLFLGVSAFLNIFGDLFFVVVLHRGVGGCAIATVFSEALSAFLCWIYVRRKIPLLNLGRKWLVFDRSLLKLTLSYGIVSALQQATVQMGKLGTQGIVNTLGVEATAAFNTTNRTDDYAIIPEQNIAHAMTSVMAQNYGAGEKKRVYHCFRYGLLLEILYGTLMGILFYFFSNPIMRLFTTDREVIRLGEIYLHLIALMYILPGITNAIQGFFRGIGDLKVTLWSSLINMGTRVASTFPMVYLWHMGFAAVPWSYLVGWICMLAFEAPYLVRMWKKAKAL